jgi:hypothetical protein
MSRRGPLTEQTCLELTLLIEDAVNGIATSEQLARLDRLLIEDERARTFYAQYVHTLCGLRTWAECPASKSDSSVESTAPAGSETIPPPHARDYLRGLPSALRKFTSMFWVSLALVVVVALALAVGSLRNHFGKTDLAQQEESLKPLQEPSRSIPQPVAASDAPSVARIARSYDCVWSEHGDRLADGDRLKVGQCLQLRSGLAELQFDCGARVILQGPAQFRLESPLSAALSSGKVTATIENPAAKGFTIHSPGMEAVDLGTEFGIEISPSGLEQVHVFRGEVIVKASPGNGLPPTKKQLTASQGMEVNLNTNGARLVANNGERFARSLDDAQNNRHVLAYWRFDDHPVGVLVPESKKGNAPVRGSLDSSLNGNDLYCWSAETQPRFSGDVPATTVPQTADPNVASLDNREPPGAGVWTRDLFTMSYWSQPNPTDLQTITPATWTVEASVKPAKLDGTYQTIVVRDGTNSDAKDPKIAPFGLYITPKGSFAVRFCDVDKRSYTAIAKTPVVQENQWYHVAVTSDGKRLRLFVDSLDGKGYIQRETRILAATGSTALGRGEFPDTPPGKEAGDMGYPYIWAVGRGYYDGHIGNWFQGCIDEVRICDVALQRTEFLFVEHEKTETDDVSAEQRDEEEKLEGAH